MKILCIADDFPWPEKSGYKIRLANVVRALADAGDVDLFIRIPHDYDGDCDVPEGTPVSRVVLVRGDRPFSTPRMLGRWATRRLPRMLARADWSGARRVLSDWAGGPYDLAWYGHADSYVELGAVISAPAIVDLDNLEDQRIRHLRAARARDRQYRVRGDPLRSPLRALAARTFDWFDERRWASLQRVIASRAGAVTLCSELDRHRIGVGTVEVVPNGYDLDPAAPARPPMTAHPRDAAVLTLVGLLTYEPNIDAAWFFAEEVLPRVRTVVPRARLRLVGRYDDFAAPLGARDGVDLLGEVPDIGAELARADVSVVPIRFGAGTRIKVLEAFARRIPVVSTTVGCEGLDVEPGRHALIADDPADLASACLQVLEDTDLRDSLVDAAFELWDRRYRWSALRPTIVVLARRVAGPGAESEATTPGAET